MTWSGKALLLVAALALVSPAAAQDVPAENDVPEEESPSGSIVVTGNTEPVTFGEIRRQARAVTLPTGPFRIMPLARFEDRLCPGVIGLDPDFAALFNQRIRANAANLDIRLMDGDCEANFVVVFAEDGDAILRRLMEQAPERFRFMDSRDESFMFTPGPVHVWTNVEPRTLTGMPIAQVRDLTRAPVSRVAGAHSRIYNTTRRDITGVMIVFDRSAVSGLTVMQLADHATMRGLAQTRVPDEAGLDTILNLFESETPPLELTPFDRAYLRSIYEGMANLPAHRRLGGTVHQLRTIIAEADESGDD